MSRVQEVLSQVAAEHPLPEDAPLLQLLLGGPGLHEGAQEGDQLPVFFRYWGGRRCRYVRVLKDPSLSAMKVQSI